MVQISTQLNRLDNGMFDADAWLIRIRRRFTPEQANQIAEAWALIQAVSDAQGLEDPWSGTAFSLEMAVLLDELQAGPMTITGALLLPFHQGGWVSLEKMTKAFDMRVANLVRGAKDMGLISKQQVRDQASTQSFDGLRKMLLAMINDVRVVLIKLAERAVSMRRCKFLDDDTRLSLAREVMQVYAPLANRLGIGQVKWELEDRAFGCLHPEAYQEIREQLQERRIDREAYITAFLADLTDKLRAMGVEASLSGRAKHIYSIWRKMQLKDLGFDRLFDIQAIRIMVRDVSDCYQALSCVHDHWSQIQSEFKDYIAQPKANGYQSIHTVVQGPADKIIEVQIRTYHMHEESEMGVAAHWRYKEGSKRDVDYEQRIGWLRSLLDWQREIAGEGDELDAFAQKVLDERIYVLTPMGDVFDLPRGATPVDFAYAVHTQVGHRTRGAKVDGKMVPLTRVLETGECVEILTGSEARPSRDWLSQSVGYVHSKAAREKIAHWFRQEHKDDHRQQGRELFHKALTKAKLTGVDVAALARSYQLSVSDFYAALSTGDVRINQVVGQLLASGTEADAAEEGDLAEVQLSREVRSTTDLIIHGVDKVMSHTAGCCRPVLGDDIIGYVTQGRGVSVHRQNCSSFLALQAKYPERVINVAWGAKPGRAPVSLQLIAQASDSLLKSVTNLLATEQLPILQLNAVQNRRKQSVNIALTIEVEDRTMLDRIMTLLNQLPTVIEVIRQ